MLRPAQASRASKSAVHSGETAAARSPTQTSRERYQTHQRQYFGGQCAMNLLKKNRWKQDSESEKNDVWTKYGVFPLLELLSNVPNRRHPKLQHDPWKHRPLREVHHSGRTGNQSKQAPPAQNGSSLRKHTHATIEGEGRKNKKEMKREKTVSQRLKSDQVLLWSKTRAGWQAEKQQNVECL